MKRSEACEDFLKRNEVNCCSIIADGDEGDFSPNGCDCCDNGLGCTTYDCNGYNPTGKHVVELGAVCHECICYFYNGECDEEI